MQKYPIAPNLSLQNKGNLVRVQNNRNKNTTMPRTTRPVRSIGFLAMRLSMLYFSHPGPECNDGAKNDNWTPSAISFDAVFAGKSPEYGK